MLDMHILTGSVNSTLMCLYVYNMATQHSPYTVQQVFLQTNIALGKGQKAGYFMVIISTMRILVQAVEHKLNSFLYCN